MYADVAIPLIDYITGNSFIHCGATSWGCMLMWPSPWLITSQVTASFIVGLHHEDVCWCGHPLDYITGNSFIHCGATSWGCMLMWPSSWLITSQVTASFIVGLHHEDVCWCGHPLDYITGNSFIHCGATSWGCMLMWPSSWLITSQVTASFIVGLHREDVCWCGHPLDWLITSQVTASFIVGLHREDVCWCGHPLDWLHHR